MHKLFDLSGKLAVVTRCTSEIGRQMAEGLAQAGADIVGIDCFGPEYSGVETAVRGYGREFYRVDADLSKTAVIPGIIQDIVRRHGKIDILIAYSNEQSSVAEPQDVSWDEYLRIVDKNQNAMVRMALLVYEQMLKQNTGGKIVIASSSLAERTGPDTLAYTITKNAVVGLMRTLAVAGAQHKIWVNAIAPGVVETQAVSEEIAQAMAHMQGVAKHLGVDIDAIRLRIGKPEDLRGAAVFLSSEASDYIVGQIFRVDGGVTSRIA